jgi:hypothetical protein
MFYLRTEVQSNGNIRKPNQYESGMIGRLLQESFSRRMRERKIPVEIVQEDEKPAERYIFDTHIE